MSKLSSRILVSLSLFLLLSGIVMGAHAWRSSASNIHTSISTVALRANTVEVETVSVVLGPHGFTPASVERPAGQFRLAVDNQSGVQPLTLQIMRDRGGLVKEWSVPASTQTSSEIVDLPAGGYVLTEANNPAWLFHITVQ